MKKFYFLTPISDLCYTLDHHVKNAKKKRLKKIELYEAEPEKNKDMFFCKAVQQVSKTGMCGKICEHYLPMNGKKGICRHKSNKLYTPGKKVTFKIN